jgi:SsrA-binding protein
MPYTKLVAQNKKAYHDFEILEKYEGGLVLKGAEVKSLRLGEASIKESFLAFSRGELWIEKMHINPYKPGFENLEPLRRRKILMKKSELKRLAGRVSEKGLTLIPLKIYFKDDWAKLEFGLARGKKRYDKRAAIKEKTIRRETDRFLSARHKKM